MRSSVLTLLSFLLLASAGLEAQTGGIASPDARYHRESGNYLYKNYTTRDYRGSAQNWAVVQDLHGNMVFANSDGVLLYDGKKWHLVETPSESVIRSLAMNDDGIIYVGALDDLGYIGRAPNNRPIYISLLDKLDPQLREMGNIWDSHVHGDDIYFAAETGLFLWSEDRFRFWRWPDADAFHKTFIWNDVLYVYEEGIGIMTLKNEKFVPSAGGTILKNKRVYAAMPLGNNQILLGTKYDGLYVYNGKDIDVFETEANEYLKKFEVYTGQTLPDGTIAVGTKFGGAILLEKDGRVRASIRREQGLPTNNVRALGSDRNNDLWLALDEGITHVEISNGITVYDERTGLETAANDICRYHGNIYANTANGTFILKPSSAPGRPASFEHIGLPKEASCWSFVVVENKLLISSSIGIFELHGKTITKITDTPSVGLHRMKADSNSIIVARQNDLQILEKKDGKWTESLIVADVRLDNVKFNETNAGRIWLTTYSQGATLVSFVMPDGTINYKRPTVKRFGLTDGLPEGFIKINNIGGQESFRVGSDSRLLLFDYNKSRFYADSTIAKRTGFSADTVFPVTDELPTGEFLVKSRRRDDGVRQFHIVKRNGEAYDIRTYDLSRVTDNVGVITYWDKPNNVVWHVGMEIIARQRLDTKASDTTRLSAFVNKIIAGGDSVIHESAGPLPQSMIFPHKLASFRFEFTSNNFIAEEANTFQYLLEGHDSQWSEWSSESMKEYSRLWEGEYTFSVRARNYAGMVSEPQSFSFEVSAPWYRTLLAYVAYLVAAVYIIVMLIKWRSGKLEQEKISLQSEIAHQTKEIRQQNIQLAAQSEELRANAGKLKELDTLKSAFFINISHEFRTPLSLIIGPLEKCIVEETHHIGLHELHRMHRNAKRLQQLINQLLELAKLESGNVKIVEQRSDLFYFVRVLAASFESLADVRNIEFEVIIPAGSFESEFDAEKVETIIFNLLSNAFKFTPEGGRIRVELKLNVGADASVEITVADTGAGIPVESINRIFDRFYQVDDSSSRQYEGSGIGLSLVKELVQLLNGIVEVESEVNRGTKFSVTLPLSGELMAQNSASNIAESGPSDLLSEQIPRIFHDRETGSPDESRNKDALVLIIEDNSDLRDYLCENLEQQYQIQTAANGESGLTRAIELIPDLIISDMMMPIMDGFELCKHIRSDPRTSHIPFILLTARATVESKLAGLELGADDYLTKPFNINEVQVRVKNLLHQRKTLRKSFSKQVTIQPKNIAITSVDERFLDHAMTIMETHLADHQFSVERFAEEIGMSRKNLLRKIKALTDQSVNEFIRNYRLKRAASLIEGKAGTVSEIAYQVGFNNLSYFAKCFRELFGIAPNEMAARSTANS
jgi:signal transduction histidine kinase/DNA-binding response OmpR family regulator